MASTNELMAAGMPSTQARLLGLDPITTASAAGTTAATATTLTVDFANVTVVAANAGVKLQSPSLINETCCVINNGANPLSVYPQTGGQINGLGANVAIVLAPGKAAFFRGSGAQWAAVVSA